MKQQVTRLLGSLHETLYMPKKTGPKSDRGKDAIILVCSWSQQFLIENLMQMVKASMPWVEHGIDVSSCAQTMACTCKPPVGGAFAQPLLLS